MVNVRQRSDLIQKVHRDYRLQTSEHENTHVDARTHTQKPAGDEIVEAAENVTGRNC